MFIVNNSNIKILDELDLKSIYLQSDVVINNVAFNIDTR